VNRTKIQWAKNPDGTPGWTWNPITGCLNGCKYCYARKLANGRLRKRYLANKNLARWHEPTLGEYGFSALSRALSDPFYPRFWPDRLKDLPTNVAVHVPWSKSLGIFVCDMGELFGDWIPKEWQERIFETIKHYSWHRFYLLTKQPQNLAKFSPFPDNCWVGVTATNTDTFFRATMILAEIQASIKFISLEPLLNWESNYTQGEAFEYAEISWLIIGCQTPPSPETMPKFEWVEEIVNAADRVGTPVFIKPPLSDIMDYHREEMPRNEKDARTIPSR